MVVKRRPRKRQAIDESSRWLSEEPVQDVIAGRTDTLDLNHLFALDASTLPEWLRQLAGLRKLTLKGGFPETRVDIDLPAWLDELTSLEEIDVSLVHPTSMPALPGVRWGLNADTLAHFSKSIDPARVFALSFDGKTPLDALRHLLKFAQDRTVSLSSLLISESIRVGGTREQQAAEWHQNLDWIERHIDAILEAQSGLATLHIYGCPIGRIPAAIQSMTSLTTLALAGMYTNTVPDWLFELPALERLDLSFLALVDQAIPIDRARRLTELTLRSNKFTSIPPGIWALPDLTSLDMSECPLERIPPDILRLTKLEVLHIGDSFGWRSEPGLDAVPEELVSPPPEIAARGLDAIKRYWLQEQETGVDYLAEAKLLIVGEAGAGKTSLSKKILDPTYALDASEDSTEGIAVQAWQFPTALRVRDADGERFLERDFRVNIWDFGGQEIYHATHQFFLTKRSVYVLVSDERKEDTDFQYWLEVVHLLSGGSPLIIVQNRKQGRAQALNVGGLRAC